MMRRPKETNSIPLPVQLSHVRIPVVPFINPQDGWIRLSRNVFKRTGTAPKWILQHLTFELAARGGCGTGSQGASVSSEGLDSTIRGLKHHTETLTDNQHIFRELTPRADAFSSEVLPVRFAPVRQRPIALAFSGCELSGHFIEGHDIHRDCLDDAQRGTRPVRDNAEIAGLRQALVLGLKRPNGPSCCSLNARQNKRGERICQLLAVAEGEGLVEVRLVDAAGRLGIGLPELCDVRWNRHGT